MSAVSKKIDFIMIAIISFYSLLLVSCGILQNASYEVCYEKDGTVVCVKVDVDGDGVAENFVPENK